MSLNTKTYVTPVARTVADLRAQVSAWRKAGETIAMVPTMGALHEGHLSLIDVGRQNDATKCIASIFVNPTQFGPGEDFDAYPRTEPQDASKLAGRADLIFAPNAREMYPDGFNTSVTVSGVTNTLEGEARPTHFNGVAVIVSKLLLSALPDIAIFGEKDYQQLLTIRRMVADLNIPVHIIGGPIMREADGLAMSSRNVYLTEPERKAAGQLNVIVRDTAAAIAKGADIESSTQAATKHLLELGFAQVDYLTVRDAETLAPMTGLDRPARILVAARIGKPRLLDNMPVV